ncbi:MAG: FtsX-like permease family protein [Bacteroidaceae bacterium]
MMKSYLVFLSRNKLYTAIELLGMSVALGFVLLLASYAITEFNVGKGQPHSQDLYALGTVDSFGMTLGTADEFFPALPEITSWTRVADYGGMDITVDGDYYHVQASAVDTNFLQLFDYRLMGCGRERILSSADQVIISERFARTAFAGENPLGRTIKQKGKEYVVTAVMQDFGPKDIFTYCDLFLSMEAMKGLLSPMDNFGSVHTFVTLAPGTNPDSVAEKLLDKYCACWSFYHRDASSGSFLYGSTLTRLDEMYFSGIQSYDILRTGDKKMVEILLIVALVLLVSAIFNYINLTVAQAGKRAHEMATRRLLGESRQGILIRYIRESFLFTLACFGLGELIAFGFRPWIGRLLDTDIVMQVNWQTAALALALVCIISLIAGLMPAILAARLKPLDVVKGSYRFRSKMLLSRLFIVCQNVISTVLIAMALTMTIQMRHLATLPTGYSTQDLIVLTSYYLGFRDLAPQRELAKRIKALPCVQDVGMCYNTPLACSHNGLHLDDEHTAWMAETSVDSVSFRLLGFHIIEQYSDALEGTCWITQETQKRFGITEQKRTLGRIEDGHAQYECCGIIADYRSRNALFEPMQDTHNVVVNTNNKCSRLLIKTTGDHKDAMQAVAKTWRQTAVEYLGIPKEADAAYLDDMMNESLTYKRNTMTLVNIFMVLSIMISALGLFAMSVFYSQQQRKTVALHKIAGAETWQVVLSLSRPFMVATMLSVVIAIPVSIRFIQDYLEGFYYRISFPWWALVVAALLSLVISVLSILSQTFRTARANPIDSIRAE